MLRDRFVPSLLGSLLCAALVFAVSTRQAPAQVGQPVATIDTLARQAFLIDSNTGTVLLQKNADEPMPPASMSKMMTAYMVFERLKDGRLKPDDTFAVSENAWRKGGAKSGSSSMFLNIDQQVRVEDLIRGIIVQSGNDASIVVAEGLAGSEEAFAEQVTKRARALGLKGTTFRNATGLPDPGDITTARDLALLAKRTIEDFPEYYHHYAEASFTYNGIRQGNRNPLLYKNFGADGLKTGHTEASGYGLTASARQGDRRLILVINGLPSMQARAHESERLMSWGFREFDNYPLLKANEEVTTADVWMGQQTTVPLVVDRDLTVTLPRKARSEMKATVTYDGPIPAPIAKGDRLAILKILAPNVATVEAPLTAGASVERLGVFGRFHALLTHAVHGCTN